MKLSLIIVLSLGKLENAVASFSPGVLLPNNIVRRHFHSSSLVAPCFAAARDSSAMDDLRRLLEASWNAESMGSVPTNVESAAESAVASAMNALSHQAATGGAGAAGDSSGGGNILNVDILLPQFDISLGKNLYDEVLSVDFCIALANRFKQGTGKSCILVRDGETVRIVRRVLDARENENKRSQQPITAAGTTTALVLDNDDDDEVDVYDDEGEDDDDDDESELDDAFSIGGKSSTSTEGKSDVDAFRRQLMAGWDSSEADETTSKSSSSSKDNSNRSKRKRRSRSTRKLLKEEASPRVSSTSSAAAAEVAENRRYRLCSMFGNASIPQGTDMMRAAVEAVAANALPEPDEETIIILSAVSREEMIAVRSLVAKYQGTGKTFILVNCKLGPPVPVELRKAQTVYSILPLIAKPTQRPENIFFTAGQDNRSKVSSSAAAAAADVMKIVVLRRFPRDWEVFVDCQGKGFELAATVPAAQVPQQGPSMEWVSSSVKRFLQFKA